MKTHTKTNGNKKIRVSKRGSATQAIGKLEKGLDCNGVYGYTVFKS